MTTNTAPAAGVAESLRRLYFVRFGFALVWAGLLFTSASSLGPVAIALLVNRRWKRVPGLLPPLLV